MAGGEVGECLGYSREEFDLLVGDGLGEADDALVLLWRDGCVGELFKAGDEGAPKAVKAVTVRGDGGVLAAVEVFANLLRGIDAMVEIGDE